MGPEKRRVGRIGETFARRALEKKGYIILGANYRTPLGEIDLVAKEDGFIVFVEVKARTCSSLGPPCLAVTRDKARHIVRSALVYLKRYGLVESAWRVDVVSVKLTPGLKLENVEIIENAVTGDYI